MREFDDLAHAYLLYGADSEALTKRCRELVFSVYEKAAPLELTETLKRRITNDAFTDIMYIKPDGNGVKIDSVRKIKSFLALMPNEGALKFVVVHEAQLLTVEAQNAMLKLLEETPENRFIILLAQNADNLLPTVLSRLQQIKCSVPYSGGGEASGNEDVALRLCGMLLEGSIEKLFDLSAYLTKDRQKTLGLLENMCVIFRDIYSAKLTGSAVKNEDCRYLCENISSRCASKMLENVKNAVMNIKANASVVLAVEAMLINLREEYNAENSRGQI